ncbi:hypothetical protein PROFUN_08871 [Planoprotostelium fungivorum]|uniref:Uncharacterized protein n=1 Tax=Planoprotostelium fungivorum TaxID=1890364 RepID=A0A2P6NJ16_9EUKA|nr:hypothetical protein PROFUN_08871 [Planoprotostelium fungivorum]
MAYLWGLRFKFWKSKKFYMEEQEIIFRRNSTLLKKKAVSAQLKTHETHKTQDAQDEQSTNMKPSNPPQPTSRHVWNPSDLEVIKTAVMKKRKPKKIQQQFFPNVGLATVQNCVARIKKQMEREKDEDEKSGGLDSGEDSEEENPSSDRVGGLIRGALGQPSAKPQSASSNSSINITSVPSTPPRSHHAPAPCAPPPPAHVPTPSIQTTTIEGFPEHGDTHNIPVISWSWPDGMFYTLIKRSTGIAVDAFVGSDGIHKGRKTKTRSTGDLILEKTPKKRTHHPIALEISSEARLGNHRHNHKAPPQIQASTLPYVPTPSIQTTTTEWFPEHGDTHNIPVISWSWPDGMFCSDFYPVCIKHALGTKAYKCFAENLQTVHRKQVSATG